MFGKKKDPKVEKVFDKEAKDDASNSKKEADETEEVSNSEIQETGLEEFENTEEVEDSNLTEFQKEKVEKLDSVKDKISKILKSSNIEIVDENFGDEYESGSGGDSDQQQQQDYDSLKALFGAKDKTKTQELTLTIDDFDYSYIGQYVDEYDLMHMKGIKKIRLQRKHSKHLKKIIIAACAVLVVGLGAFLGYFLTRETPVVLKSVSLSQTEHDYYIYDNFDYTGLYLITEYSNGKKESIPLSPAHLFDVVGRVEQNDGQVQFTGGSLAELVFKYQGYSVNYTVNIKSKNRVGMSAIFTNGIFNLNNGDLINSDYLKVLFDYADYGKEFIDLSTDLKVEVDGTELSFDKRNGGFVLTKATTLSSVIKIKYSTMEIELTSSLPSNMVSTTI